MNEIMIVASGTKPASNGGIHIVTTPLDAIMRLERKRKITHVILAGTFAQDHELASCLGALYPAVRVEVES
jgi:hypothetical protein